MPSEQAESIRTTEAGGVPVATEMDLVSSKFNNLYLHGAVDRHGKLLNNFHQINITVQSLTDNCAGEIICAPELIKQAKVGKYSHRQSLLRNAGINYLTKQKQQAAAANTDKATGNLA